MQLSFASKHEVAVADTIPDATAEVAYPLWFCFLYAGKLLYNLPGEPGYRTIDKAVRLLSACSLEPNKPLARNFTMMGVCCDEHVEIVPIVSTPSWVYRGDLFYKGERLFITTEIARGQEEYFHGAAIDTVFEVVRRRLGDRGGVVPWGALGYFEVLRRQGWVRLRRNLLSAASVATMAAVAAGSFTPQLSQAELESMFEGLGERGGDDA